MKLRVTRRARYFHVNGYIEVHRGYLAPPGARRGDDSAALAVTSEINCQNVVTAANEKGCTGQHDLPRVIDPVSDDDGPSRRTRSRKPPGLQWNAVC
jgi:hypothetical protein